MKYLGFFKRVWDWFYTKPKSTKKRPHSYSKNAWSYVGSGQITPAMQFYVRLAK